MQKDATIMTVHSNKYTFWIYTQRLNRSSSMLHQWAYILKTTDHKE